MHFIVTRAAQAPDLARAFVEGQREALRPFGIDFIAKSNVYPEAYLVAAELEPGIPIGGLRLEQRSADHQLPLEGAIELPKASHRQLERRAEEGLVELCGLWVAPTSTVPRLGDRLVCLGLAVATSQGMGHVVALGGQHSLPLALRMGFHFEPGEPVFPYPDRRYHSRIVWQQLPSLT